MKKIAKILAPTDQSAISCDGLRHAFELARDQGAEIIFYHILDVAEDWFSRHEYAVPIRDLLAEESRRLEHFLKEQFADMIDEVKISQKVEIGAAARNIVELAKRENVDLIVMSTHGRTGMDHILLGSVTEKVIARSPCPVLVVPASKIKQETGAAA